MKTSLGWDGPPPMQMSFMQAGTINGKTRLENFISYLSSHGVSILPTGEWEILRFKCSAGTGLVYFNAKSTLNWNEIAFSAWQDHRKGVRCRVSYREPKQKISRSSYQQMVAFLLSRDGENCFICGKHLVDDISIEHILDRKFQGGDHIANLTLAHKTCNTLVGDVQTLREKIEILVNKRQESKCT